MMVDITKQYCPRGAIGHTARGPTASRHTEDSSTNCQTIMTILFFFKNIEKCGVFLNLFFDIGVKL